MKALFVLVRMMLSTWRKHSETQYVYGSCYRPDDGAFIKHVRVDRRTGEIQVRLHKAGDQGRKDDYWHRMGPGWVTYFVGDRAD